VVERAGGAVVGVVASVAAGAHASARAAGRGTLLAGTGALLRETLGGVTLDVSPRSFFQVNPAQAQELCRLVAEGADLAPHETAMDLYCGTGALGLTLARRCARVVGFEVEPSAVADARRNAAANGIANAEFVCGDLESLAADLGARYPRPDVVVVDPARAGLSGGVRAFLRGCGARRVVYVSCDAGTQARDIRDLCGDGAGPYRLARVTPVDMFPQSTHVESVAVLERRGG